MKKFALMTTAAVLVSSTAAAQVSLTQDASDFGVRESVSTVDLSPSGSQVAYIAPAANGATVALVADVNGGPVRPVLKAAGGSERLSWCRFVTDARLICGFLKRGLHPGDGHFVILSRLIGCEAAAAIALYGEEINGEKAVDLGLV